MNTDEHGLRFEVETGAIISCAFEVLNHVKHPQNQNHGQTPMHTDSDSSYPCSAAFIRGSSSFI